MTRSWTELEKQFDTKFSVAGKGELPLCEFNLRSVKQFIKSLFEEPIEHHGLFKINSITRNGIVYKKENR